jgi:predicted nuclease of restriction endonuclease-like RecB superfamily
MLPSDLIRWQIEGDRIKAVYVKRDGRRYLKLAEDVISIYKDHIGKTKGELERELARYEAYDTSYQVIRGFAKVLEEKAEFEVRNLILKQSEESKPVLSRSNVILSESEGPERQRRGCEGIEPEVLRERVFRASARSHPLVEEADLIHKKTRAEVLNELSWELGTTVDEIVRGMYADLDERRVLVRFDEVSPQWVLDRYNVALAQGMLYRCSEMRIRIFRNIPTKYKMVFKFIKFFKLMHRVSGSNEEGYHIILDGPASMFRLSQKYGIQMALFLPALLHCNRWWVDADIYVGGRKYNFFITEDLGLRSHYKDVGEFDSDLERVFAGKFERAKTQWLLERETEIINLKDTVMIPDFAFRHPSGRRALMEIVGFWTPSYLERKLDKLRRAGRSDMVIAVSENLNCGRERFADVPGEVIFFKTGIDVREVLDKVERCAAA